MSAVRDTIRAASFRFAAKRTKDAGPAAIAEAAASAALCNDATYEPADGEGGRSGDTLDVALLVLAVKAGLELPDGPRRGDAGRAKSPSLPSGASPRR